MICRRVIKRTVFLLLGVSMSALALVVLDGDYDYNAWTSPGGSSGETFDASTAKWIFANSGHETPVDAATDCTKGSLPTNNYPVNLRNSNGMTFQRGLIDGLVSLDGIWGYMYCNASAVYVNNDAYNTTIEGVRADRVWDGIRVAFDNSNNFTIKDVWLSNSRDDCIENDAYNSGVIRDSLFESCFQAISMREGKSGTGLGNTEGFRTLEIYGSLIRVIAHNHSENNGGNERFVSGHIFKSHDNAPSVIVEDSVFAYDTPTIDSSPSSDNNMIRLLGPNASKLESCSNNKILWMHDDNPPSFFSDLHSCFTAYSGQAARDQWENAKCAWIDAHPSSITRRHPGDPETCALSPGPSMPPNFNVDPDQ